MIPRSGKIPSPMDPGRQNRRRTLLLCALLGAVTLAAYWPVFHCGFVNADDPDYVVDNLPVRAGLSWHGAVWAFTTQHAANWHPLTWLSHMLDVQLFGLNAGGHHFINLLLHIANTLLLFLFWQRATGRLWRSALVAALFAVHPLHVESVAWVSERKDVLSTFFFLLTLLCHAKAMASDKWQVARTTAQNVSPVTCHRSPFYWLALFFFALGLLSKPMVVTLPFVLLLLDYWPWGRFKVRPAAALVGEKLPFFALSAASCLITFVAQKHGETVVSLGNLSFSTRVSNAVISSLLYLKKTFWPDDLAVYYPYNFSPSPRLVAVGLLVLLGVSAAAIVVGRKRPWFGVGWWWYLGTLVPVIGLVQVGAQALADRYTYIPLIGIFVLVAWGAAELVARWRVNRMVPAVAGGLVIAVCAGLTFHQARQWKDSETLFRHALAVTTDNAVAHYTLGGLLIRQRQFKEAESHLREAVRLVPNDAHALDDLGMALVGEDRIDEGLHYLREAIKIQPGYAHAYYNLGCVLESQGKPAEAVAEFQTAIQLDPGSLRSQVYRTRLADALAGMGRTDEADLQFQRLLEFNPNDAQAHWRYGTFLARIGRLDEAIEQLQVSLQLQSNLQAQQELAFLLNLAGQPRAAVEMYREVLKVRPDSAPVLNNLAWILAASSDATVRNGPEAVQLAERASQLTAAKDPVVLGTLSAAYAETGRFEEAIRTAGKANDLAVAAGNQAVAGRLQQLLAGYRAGKPCREAVPATARPETGPRP